MKRNWIVLVLAIVALASCSIEKRIYQPGYHIEWNHFASQGRSASQDLSENLEIDVVQDATQDVSQGGYEGASQDLSKNLSQNLETGASQDLSKNLEIDVVQDATQDVSQGRSEGASQDHPQDLSNNLSNNLETNVAVSSFQANPVQPRIDQVKSKHSDLETLLFILLAIFLPALTIFLLEGFSKNFWIALLLMICAFSLPFLALVVRSILEIIAIIMAISVVLHYM